MKIIHIYFQFINRCIAIIDKYTMINIKKLKTQLLKEEVRQEILNEYSTMAKKFTNPAFIDFKAEFRELIEHINSNFIDIKKNFNRELSSSTVLNVFSPNYDNCFEITGNVEVIGDIHGDVSTLLYFMEKNSLSSNFIFLGDVFDPVNNETNNALLNYNNMIRTSPVLLVFCLIFLLHTYPNKRFYFIYGNHDLKYGPLHFFSSIGLSLGYYFKNIYYSFYCKGIFNRIPTKNLQHFYFKHESDFQDCQFHLNKLDVTKLQHLKSKKQFKTVKQQINSITYEKNCNFHGLFIYMNIINGVASKVNTLYQVIHPGSSGIYTNKDYPFSLKKTSDNTPAKDSDIEDYTKMHIDNIQRNQLYKYFINIHIDDMDYDFEVHLIFKSTREYKTSRIACGHESSSKSISHKFLKLRAQTYIPSKSFDDGVGSYSDKENHIGLRKTGTDTLNITSSFSKISDNKKELLKLFKIDETKYSILTYLELCYNNNPFIAYKIKNADKEPFNCIYTAMVPKMYNEYVFDSDEKLFNNMVNLLFL
jgi:hypothetical protein